ncbi:unnamed protein product [Dovyalis caffra]|uniref:Pentatricopeptide repeat-containing protein n=1 Tax=Dovyalis caffra TaxID=77055 RepID=A0AAV1RNR4_9ROSI|nr:unnamed protein product [Dovyalis caffra]
MPNFKSLSNFFRTTIKTTTTYPTNAADTTLISVGTNLEPKTRSKKSPKPKTFSKSKKQSQPQPQPPPSTAVNSSLLDLKFEGSGSEDSATNLTAQDIAKIINAKIEHLSCYSSSLDTWVDFCKLVFFVSLSLSLFPADGAKLSSPDSEEADDEKVVEKVLKVPWFPTSKTNNIAIRRKEVTRERKQKWVFRYSQVFRMDRLVDTCADKLGTDATMEVFGKLGKETGLKEFNALMKKRVELCRETDDETVVMQQIDAVLELLRSMKEQGFSIEEETYGSFLILLIDKGMVEEFHFFSDFIKDTNPGKNARLGYYNMLLYVGVNDEEKIQELCNYICTDDGDENISLRDYGVKDLSTPIFSYATSFRNLAVEDVVSKFKTLHTVVGMSPSSTAYEKLIIYCCNLLKVHQALDMVDEMCKEGLTISINTIQLILNASEESLDFNLVRRIYSLIYHLDLTPNNETFRSMISLSVKMKDFEGAYGLLNDLKKLNLTPTASMYNAIMGGFFREVASENILPALFHKNITGALMVLDQMELADVRPDSSTYFYLISNCDNEDKINKYYEEMKVAGIQFTKQIYMALVNAYATCGKFEKAKQVLLDKGIPIKNLNEIRSVLVSALASHGQMTDALHVYEEIKQAESNLEPKAVISLIEHVESEGEQSRLLKLLEELDDPKYWVDGCSRVILYCIRHKDSRSAMDLLKQLKDRLSDDELAMEVLFDEVFSLVAETEPPDVQMGMYLLQAIKDELGVSPSRKCLDFLLSACVKAKDLRNSLVIWKEYQAAGLPMYQALLASGSHVSAQAMLNKIPKDDPHVRIIIQECQRTYIGRASRKGKKKKNKENE